MKDTAAARHLAQLRADVEALTRRSDDLHRRVETFANRPREVRHVHEPIPRELAQRARVRLRIVHPNGWAQEVTLHAGMGWDVQAVDVPEPARKRWRRTPPVPGARSPFRVELVTVEL